MKEVRSEERESAGERCGRRYTFTYTYVCFHPPRSPLPPLSSSSSTDPASAPSPRSFSRTLHLAELSLHRSFLAILLYLRFLVRLLFLYPIRSYFGFRSLALFPPAYKPCVAIYIKRRSVSLRRFAGTRASASGLRVAATRGGGGKGERRGFSLSRAAFVTSRGKSSENTDGCEAASASFRTRVPACMRARTPAAGKRERE